MNVAELFRAEAARRPTAPALVTGRAAQRQVVTFGELDQRSARIAKRLRDLGLGAGDPVFLLQPISIELYAVLLALLRLGAVPVFFDPTAGLTHIDSCCQAMPPRALIATPKAHLLRLVSQGLSRIPLRVSTGCALPGASSLAEAARSIPDRRIEARDPEDTALLSFTSGTSGRPKSVVRSHALLAAQFAALAPLLGAPGAVDLVALPIFTLACLAGGNTCIVPECALERPGRANARSLLDQISTHGVTRLMAGPALLERLLTAAPERERDFAGLTQIVTGGGPVFPDLLARLAAAAPAAKVTVLYGSTEAEPIAHLSPSEITAADEARMKRGGGLLAGPIVPGLSVRILPDRFGAAIGPFSSDAFEKASLPPGEAGEIVVSGANVAGPYADPQDNRLIKFRAGKDLWHRTGDAGYRDEEGRLWLLGRCEARIADRDGTLYTLPVEAAARAITGPRRIAFAAVDGRRVLAVEGGPVDRTALLAALQWAKVDEIASLRRLPVDPRHNAKIDHRALCGLLRRRLRQRAPLEAGPQRSSKWENSAMALRRRSLFPRSVLL